MSAEPASPTSPLPDLVRCDERSDRLGKDDIVGVSCVRNEMPRLPYFLEHQRKAGIDRFFFVDNGSTDGSLEYLLSQDDAHVYSTHASYAGSHCGVGWLNRVLHCHAAGHWALTLDADELLVYPRCESEDLHRLTQHMDAAGAETLQTFMLDMYSDRPIRDTHCQPGRPFLDICPYFDQDSYPERGPLGLPYRGGPRWRLFWDGHKTAGPSPVLQKFPLVKWRSGLDYVASTHIIRGAVPAPFSGVLLHFKFFSDLYRSAEIEARRGEHWDGAAQYKAYWQVLNEDPDASPFFSGSLKYANSNQLIALGLIKATDLLI